MISLFHFNHYTIDTSKFNNLLHGKIVDEFTRNFCDYVGIKYGCAVNSATSAIFLIASKFFDIEYQIPTMIPPVVVNALINAKVSFKFIDDTEWVGHSYTMTNNPHIIDSAQEVIKCSCQCFGPNDIIIFSYYFSKPVGSCDGGMICSNNEEIINYLSIISNNGSKKGNSWENEFTCIGWKMYMNSVQAYIANENLKKLDEKKEKLKAVRHIYNSEFGLKNSSEHLYRIRTERRDDFITFTKQQEIVCGIHYKCCHINPVYGKTESFPKSEEEEKLTVSIPYHEQLTYEEIDKVIKCVKQYQ